MNGQRRPNSVDKEPIGGSEKGKILSTTDLLKLFISLTAQINHRERVSMYESVYTQGAGLPEISRVFGGDLADFVPLLDHFTSSKVFPCAVVVPEMID